MQHATANGDAVNICRQCAMSGCHSERAADEARPITKISHNSHVLVIAAHIEGHHSRGGALCWKLHMSSQASDAHARHCGGLAAGGACGTASCTLDWRTGTSCDQALHGIVASHCADRLAEAQLYTTNDKMCSSQPGESRNDPKHRRQEHALFRMGEGGSSAATSASSALNTYCQLEH